MKKTLLFLLTLGVQVTLFAQTRDYRPTGAAKAAGNVLGTLILFGVGSIVFAIVKSIGGKKNQK